MTLEELNKLVDLELQWLKYYASEKSRNQINENTNIYKDLVSIGYAKRAVKLDIRCCPCTLTSDKPITNETDISEIKKSQYNIRTEKDFSPVETFIMLFPDKKMELLNKLIPEPDESF